MDINQIRYFLALAETLNFTRAAEKCHVSQPALTQSIIRFEEQLGGSLIHREGRSTRLTDLGRTLIGHFEKIEQTRQLAMKEARLFRDGESTDLNIGLMCTIGPRMLWQFMDDFQIGHPEISILLHDMQAGTASELLLSGVLDGVFAADHGSRDKRLSYINLFEEQMVVVFPPGHRFTKQSTVPLSMIANEKYIDRLNCDYRDEFLEYCKDNDVKLQVKFRCQREDWAQALVREGVGVSVVPEYMQVPPWLDFRPIEGSSFIRQNQFLVAEQLEIRPAVDLLVNHARSFIWSSPTPI